MRLCRGRFYRQRLDRAAIGHEIPGVVFKVERAVFVDDRAANTILCLFACRCKERIGSRVGFLGFPDTFDRRIVCFFLSLFVAQDTERAGRVVIQEVNVVVIVVACGEKAARLRIALRVRTVRNGHRAAEVNYCNAMAGVFRELSAAAGADIGAAVCNDRRRRTHTADGQLRAVCQLPCAVRILPHSHTVEIAALGIKVEGVCSFIVADGASDIARKACHGIQQLAAHRVQQQDIGCLACIAAFAIICTNKHIVPAYICTGPIEAALLHIPPCWGLRFLCFAGVFVGQRDADKAGVLYLAVPEACIGITV